MTKKISPIYSLPAIIISTLLVVAGIWAWTDAPASPPNSNVAAPINSGSIGQSKTGGVILNTGGAAIGLIVDKGDVGIGTSNPGAKLQISGSTGFDYKINSGLRVALSNDNLFIYRPAENVFAIQAVRDGVDMSRPPSDPNAWPTALVLNPTSAGGNGNVGIGTINPGANLDIAADNPVLKLQVNSGVNQRISGIEMTGTFYNSADVGARKLGKIEVGSKVGDWEGSYMKFNVAGINCNTDDSNISKAGCTRMLIDANGNVGIGTADPKAKLSFNNLDDGSNGADGITWYNPSPTAYGIYRTAGAWTSNTFQQLRINFDTGIQLGAGTGIGAGYDKSYVEVVSGKGLMVTSGNVGIGTIIPNNKLTVVAGSDTWAASFFGAATGNQVRIGTYSGVAAIGANNNAGSAWTTLSIQPAIGSVSIGTVNTHPSAKLYVAGSIVANTDVCLDSGKCLSTVSSGGDNLGNHTATQNLQMGSYSVCLSDGCRNTWPSGSGSGDITGVYTNNGLSGGSSSGDATVGLNPSGFSGCGNSITGKVYWDGSRLVCATDQNTGGGLPAANDGDTLRYASGAWQASNYFYNDGEHTSIGGGGDTGWVLDINKGNASQGLRITTGQSNPSATLFQVDQYGGGTKFRVDADGMVCINGTCKDDWSLYCYRRECNAAGVGSNTCTCASNYNVTGGGVVCWGALQTIHWSYPGTTNEWVGNCVLPTGISTYVICCK